MQIQPRFKGFCFLISVSMCDLLLTKDHQPCFSVACLFVFNFDVVDMHGMSGCFDLVGGHIFV